jgi:hypothetical protein
LGESSAIKESVPDPGPAEPKSIPTNADEAEANVAEVDMGAPNPVTLPGLLLIVNPVIFPLRPPPPPPPELELELALRDLAVDIGNFECPAG